MRKCKPPDRSRPPQIDQDLRGSVSRAGCHAPPQLSRGENVLRLRMRRRKPRTFRSSVSLSATTAELGKNILRLRMRTLKPLLGFSGKHSAIAHAQTKTSDLPGPSDFQSHSATTAELGKNILRLRMRKCKPRTLQYIMNILSLVVCHHSCGMSPRYVAANKGAKASITAEPAKGNILRLRMRNEL